MIMIHLFVLAILLNAPFALAKGGAQKTTVKTQASKRDSTPETRRGALPRKEKRKRSIEDIVKSAPEPEMETLIEESEDKKGGGKGKSVSKIRLLSTQDRLELCHQYLASPIWTSVFLKDSNLYFLARAAKFSGVTATTKAKYIYRLFRITIDEKKPRATQLVSLRGPQAVGLLAHANPAEGFTVLFYKGLTAGCGSGRAVGTSISLALNDPRTNEEIRPKPRRTINDGEYKLVESDQGRQFADLERKTMRQIDNYTFQLRTSIQYKESYDPLYWYVARREIFIYDRENRSLKSFRTRMNNIMGNEKLGENEKILQDRLAFGFLELNLLKNSFRLKELKKWTRVNKDRAYSFAIPEKYDVSDAGVVVNFPTRRVIVHGGSNEARNQWDKIFFFHYGSNRKLFELNLMRQEALTAVLFNKSADSAVIITHHKSSLLHFAIRIFRINEGKWITVSLPKPVVEKKAEKKI